MHVQNLCLNYFLLTPTVDGNYGEWSAWDTCSVTCGDGNSTRTRVCGGTEGSGMCEGHSEETMPCTLAPCPSVYLKIIVNAAVTCIKQMKMQVISIDGDEGGRWRGDFTKL